MQEGKTKHQKIIVILGPTGIGKTQLVLDLAQRVNGEIVSADSVQVYRYMDIGSAKPHRKERNRVAHHLIDVVNPDEEFSAGRYQHLARQAIDDIASRGKRALVSGGTGFYIKALIRGLVSHPAADEAYRDHLRFLEAKEGRGYLYNQLILVDPEAAKNIHPNDIFRIIRALEVYHVAGTPLSALREHHRFLDTPYESLQIGLHCVREQLYAQINERVDQMMEQGFLKEVKDLLKRGYHPGLKSMQVLGYRHLCAYLSGHLSLAEAIRIMKRDTRRYAKRQLTWFRSDPAIVWVDLTKHATDEVMEKVKQFLESNGYG